MQDNNNLSCQEVKELISPLCDRELSSDEQKIVKQHLETCKDCAYTSSMMVGIKRVLGHWEGIKASATFHTKVMERIKDEPSWQVKHRRNMIVLGAISFVAILSVILAVIFYKPSPKDPTTPVDPDKTAAVVEPAKQAASVELLENTVKLSRPTGEVSLVTEQDIIDTNSTVITEQSSRVGLRLNTGYRLMANASSKIKLISQTKLEVISGGIFIESAGSAQKPITIVVNNQECLIPKEVCSLFISIDKKGNASIYARRGSATLSTASGKLFLSAGLVISLGKDGSHIDGPKRPKGGLEDTQKALERWSNLK